MENKTIFTLDEMKKMYDISCGSIGLSELPNKTQDNERFKQFLKDIVSLEIEIFSKQNMIEFGKFCIREFCISQNRDANFTEKLLIEWQNVKLEIKQK